MGMKDRPWSSAKRTHTEQNAVFAHGISEQAFTTTQRETPNGRARLRVDCRRIPGAERPRPDRPPQLVLDLRGQRSRRSAPQGEKRLDRLTGLVQMTAAVASARSPSLIAPRRPARSALATRSQSQV
jgi:hypothetical protein